MDFTLIHRKVLPALQRYSEVDFTLIHRKVLPALQRYGLTEPDPHLLMVENPKGLLAGNENKQS